MFNQQTRRMPVAGLGTWLSSEAEADDMVDAALEAGIRLIDNSILYENEAAIGKTLRRWIDTGRLKRRDLFVASKLPIMGMEPCLVEFYVDMSLKNLGLEYFDLYLIHTPFGIERDDASGGFKMVDGKVGYIITPFSPSRRYALCTYHRNINPHRHSHEPCAFSIPFPPLYREFGMHHWHSNIGCRVAISPCIF